MLLSGESAFFQDDFRDEADFEASVLKVKRKFFGDNRVYLDFKKKIGKQGRSC